MTKCTLTKCSLTKCSLTKCTLKPCAIKRQPILAWTAVVALILGATLAVIPAVDAKANSLDVKLDDVKLDPSGAAPRKLEDTTREAIVRDYAAAWESMEQALDQNRADVLASAFAGTARQKFAQAIGNQQRSGLRTVYVDHGHALKAMFYAQEGSAMQLRDIANYELRVFDHGTMIYSEQVTQPYIVVMTPTSDHWQVRILEAAPE